MRKILILLLLCFVSSHSAPWTNSWSKDSTGLMIPVSEVSSNSSRVRTTAMPSGKSIGGFVVAAGGVVGVISTIVSVNRPVEVKVGTTTYKSDIKWGATQTAEISISVSAIVAGLVLIFDGR